MSSNGGQLDLWLVLGLGGGIVSFFKGFRVYREYRVVEDTPEIPIRSIPMGLVHIHGKALGDERVTSPITHTPCYYYKVDIEKWKTKNNSGSWQHECTDQDGVKFYLEDSSGKVLVDLRGAEYDLEQSGNCETGGGSILWKAGEPDRASAPTETELREYVNKASAHRIGKWIERGISFVGSQHDSDPERERKRQEAMAVFGHGFATPEFFQEMMKRSVLKSQPVSDAQQEQARLAMVEAFKHPMGSPEFRESMQRAADLAPDKEKADFRKFLAFMESGQTPMSGWPTSASVPAASGRYRFTEHCILPNHVYDLTGTCVENPTPKDEHDRNLVVRGHHESTLLISYRNVKEVEKNLRSRAAWMVFGGGGVAIGCLGILLAKLGWL